MIPGPVSKPTGPDTALLLDGYPTFADRSAWRAAHPNTPEPAPCDKSRALILFDPPADAFHVIDLQNRATPEVGPFAGPNLPNDAQTFPAWTGNGPTDAVLHRSPNFSEPLMPLDLCTAAEAAFVVAQLNASEGISATLVGDYSAPGESVDYKTETRRRFGVNVNGSVLYAARFYALIASKVDAQCNSQAGGVGAPGSFVADAGAAYTGYLWVPQAPPTEVLGKPCREMVPPEFIGPSPNPSDLGALMVQVPATAPATGASSDEAKLDEILAEEKKIEGALGIK